MRLTLSVRDKLEDSANRYFEAAKKARKKLEGAKLAVAKASQKKPAAKKLVARRKKDWYEQYRWMLTPEKTLIIGGKDATSNEVIIKKHLLQTDTVLHTDASGSPFVVIKGPASSTSLDAASVLCAVYSKAWKAGIAVADVFWVKPEQVSKTPNTGEYINKGSFIIRGEKHYLQPRMEISLGIIDFKPMAGLPAFFELAKASYVTLKPGNESSSDIAKKLSKKLGLAVDDWLALIPAGGCVITTYKNTLGDNITNG